ncbi:DUF4906 domain-containing protein [Segatella paludivivens]|uniref:DUF4906 domain-containing protein n=1 Tax=Segatella paludivivens TaxID=185294 RepID=UPI0004718160|nr:DUF4906 domain-containing protein [Segatella paludivivens]
MASVAAGSVDVTTRSATGCTIYAIANTGSSSYFAGVNTIDKLNKMSTTIASAADLENSGSTANSTGAMMIGKASADIIKGAVNKFPVTLYHQCGKFSFTIKPNSGVTITGYQLCNVPLSSYITDSHVPASASTVAGPPVGASSYGNFTAVSGLSQTTDLSKTYYVYENLCGSNINATSEALRNSSNVPVSASASASYLLINAKSSNWTSTYRVYLGGMTNVATPAVDLTNFNVYRNLNYNCTITLGANGGNGDARVTYQATTTRSNMYVGDATVGNYLYDNGTNGSVYSASHTVGIIYSSELTQAQYNAGCRHGRVLALKNANSSNYGTWGSGSPYNDHSSTGHPYVSDFKTCFQDVSSGYDALSANSSYVNITSNYAWYYCKTYSDGTTHSGDLAGKNWYLPSAGDWWDIMENLGTWSASDKTTLTTNRSSTTGLGYIISTSSGSYFDALNTKLSVAGGDQIVPSGSYPYNFWSASEAGSGAAARFYFSSDGVYLNYNNKTSRYYCRSVLAF